MDPIPAAMAASWDLTALGFDRLVPRVVWWCRSGIGRNGDGTGLTLACRRIVGELTSSVSVVRWLAGPVGDYRVYIRMALRSAVRKIPT